MEMVKLVSLGIWMIVYAVLVLTFLPWMIWLILPFTLLGLAFLAIAIWLELTD